jgi:hypothetical protein
MTESVSTILTALEQAVAAGSARISWSTDASWSFPATPAPERGPVSTAALGVAKAAGKAIGGGLVKLVSRGRDPWHLNGEGVLDLTGRRFMVDYDSYAVLQVRAQEWSGRSGRSLSTLAASAPHIPSPLWLVDLVAGVKEAEDRGTEQVDGQAWRHLLAVTDLAAASARRPEGMASPARERYEELLALPLEVWLQDGHLRRLRFVVDERTDTVTFTDFGVPVDGLDWSRLPASSSS